MNIYHIQYFGLLSERRGKAEETILHEAKTPAELYDFLESRNSLGMSRADVRAAVNDEFAAWDRPLMDQDHIAYLPPMSGG